jgi:electron transfer flavoprotein beta subunit
LKIVVCVKQVPQTEQVRIDQQTNTLVREGVDSMLNPFDEFAVEEALRIGDLYGGEIAVVTMGPPQAERALATCCAMGANRGYLLSDACLAGSDTLATAFALSRLIKKIGFDLILCGQESTDSSTGQVGPEIAEFLDIPQVTFASRIDFVDKSETGRLSVQRETDRGYQTIQTSLPALITVVKGINQPREPLASHNAAVVTKLDASSLGCSRDRLGAEGSPTRVVKIEAAVHRERERVLIDSKLPASVRLQQLITGGIGRKENAVKIHGSSAEAVERAADFIVHFLYPDHSWNQ